MRILPVTDPSFAAYGRIVEGYDFGELLRVLDEVSPLPEGVVYVPDQPKIRALAVTGQLAANAYGGMPIQTGYCSGHNTRLNCLEYHRDSELNLGIKDFILLVASRTDMENGRLDTAKVKAFRCPAGVMVEVYATTLHYAPCSAEEGQGFKVLIVLPEGTNGPRPDITPLNDEDRMLWACNKWLLAHGESAEAKEGAAVLLDGENIDIAGLL